MGSRRVEDVPHAAKLTGNEKVHVVQNGNSRWATVSEILQVNDSQNAPLPPLTDLQLGGSGTVAENTAEDTVVGALLGRTVGSTLTVLDNAGGRFKESSGFLVRGPTALDYEGSPLIGAGPQRGYTVQIQEAKAGVSNSPRVTNITVIVTDVAEGGGFTVTTPQIDMSQAVAGDNPPRWFLNTVDANGAVGTDTIRLRWSVNGGAYSFADEVLDTELLDETVVLFPEFDGFVVGNLLSWNVCVVRAGVQVSDWSPAAAFSIADGDPSAWDFVDQVGVAGNTQITSAPVTPTGYAVPTRITVAGGEYSLDGGAFTAAEGVINPGQVVRCRVTSSPLAGDVKIAIVTIGTVAATFQTTTTGVSVTFTASTTQPGRTTGTTTTKTINNVPFVDGRGLIFTGPQGGNIVSVTIGGIACTQIHQVGSEVSIWRTNSDLATGNLAIVLTTSTNENFDVLSGTLKNSGSATAGGVNWSFLNDPIDSGSLTCPTDGLIIGMCGVENAIGPPVVTNGTMAITFDGSSHDLNVAIRSTTGNLSWADAGSNFKGAIWAIFAKAP